MEKEKLVLNVIDFAENFLKLPNGNKIKLADYQKAFLLDCMTEDRVIGIFSRQSGKSTSIAIYALWHSLMVNNTRCLIVSPTQEQSNLLFQKIKDFINLTPELKEQITTELQFKNNSTIKSLPVGPDGRTIRGHSANLIILEESAFIKDSVVNTVIMPMAAAQKNPKIIQISTPFSKNHFYEAAMSKRYATHLYGWEYAVRAGIISKDYITEQRELLTSLEFDTEYNAKFLDVSNCYFGKEVDEAIEEIKERPPFRKNIYTLGVDFARFGQDSSVFIIIEQDWRTRVLKVVNVIERKHGPLTEAIGIIKLLDKKYNFSKIVLDETGLGSGPTDLLKEQIGGKILPVTFTLKSKQDIYSNLKTLLESKKLKLINDKKLIYQMKDLRYEVMSSGDIKIHHSERGHDDFPDALALAVYPFKIKKKQNYNIIGI